MLGRSRLSTRGDIVNDSHAEIIARRALLRFSYSEIEWLIKGNDGNGGNRVFEFDSDDDACGRRFRMREGWKFHMYISQLPCGDASDDSLDHAIRNVFVEEDSVSPSSKLLGCVANVCNSVAWFRGSLAVEIQHCQLVVLIRSLTGILSVFKGHRLPTLFNLFIFLR